MTKRKSFDSDIHRRLQELKQDHFEALPGTGANSYERTARDLNRQLVSEFGTERISEELVLPLLLADLKASVEKRAIENRDPDEEQRDLFGRGFLDSIVKVDASSYMRVGDAGIDVMEAAHRRQGEHLERASRKFDISKRRLEILRPVMEADRDLTVEQALARINRNRDRPPPKDEDRPRP